MNDKRIQAVMTAMEKAGVPQLLICDPHTISYLTGDLIHPGERFLGFLLRLGQEPRLFLNRLFAAPHIPQNCITFYDDTQHPAVMAAEAMDSKLPLGVDKNLAAQFLLEMQQCSAASSYCNGSVIVDQIRACKDEEEIQLMANASRLNDLAMEAIKGEVRCGVTEAQLAQRLLEIYHELGAEGFSFSPIISFGAHAADPHHEPDDTPLQPGECVLFDIGCKKDGYCSDMTRTFYFGTVTEEERKIYEAVKAANLAGEAAIHPGARFCDIDRAARKVIEDAGYGPYFTHRLGHSAGTEVHEWGDVSSTNEAQVKPGMIFSCEPGIYLVGNTGVRIEDLCLVTEDGVRVLNQASKELEVIPVK